MAHVNQRTWFAIDIEHKSNEGRARETGEFCVENIGVNQRRMRAMSGVLMAIVSIVIAAILLTSGADRAWRLVLFLPLMLSGFGFFQAREHT